MSGPDGAKFLSELGKLSVGKRRIGQIFWWSKWNWLKRRVGWPNYLWKYAGFINVFGGAVGSGQVFFLCQSEKFQFSRSGWDQSNFCSAEVGG